LLYGRGLYPRFYAKGRGVGFPDSYPEEYARLSFYVIRPGGSAWVELATSETPKYFPNESDVFVVGCRSRYQVYGLFVLVKGENGITHLYTHDSLVPFPCSLD